MQRRAFLKGSAALPAGLEMFAIAQAETLRADGQVHVVEAGEDGSGEKHTMGFSTMLFKTTTQQTNGDLFVREHMGLGKAGPPMHLHLHQDEWFYVMEGEVLFQVGDDRVTLKPGESVLGPRGIPHAFAGAGDKPAHLLITFTPAGKMEEFFRRLTGPNPPKLTPEFFAEYECRYAGPPLEI